MSARADGKDLRPWENSRWGTRGLCSGSGVEGLRGLRHEAWRFKGFQTPAKTNGRFRV